MAVAAALYVLLPAELGLGYLEVLAVFMASIVIGLISHVPGSLGVFESAVVLLLQPTEAQTLPLIGSLLAFRGVYYLLPLVCGVVVLAVSEVHRWRTALAAADRPPPHSISGRTTPIARPRRGGFVAGLALLLVGQPLHASCGGGRPCAVRRRLRPRRSSSLAVSPCCCWRAACGSGSRSPGAGCCLLLAGRCRRSVIGRRPLLLAGYLRGAGGPAVRLPGRLRATGRTGRRLAGAGLGGAPGA